MTDSTKRNAGSHPGGFVDTKLQTNLKPTGVGNAAQHSRPDHYKLNRQPAYPELPGAKALRQLSALWGPPRQVQRRGRR